ncbi:MAG: tetratricopeptide repeat protein [bacterium]|nr:tetratricopeptide repeat protein [bacterium]
MTVMACGSALEDQALPDAPRVELEAFAEAVRPRVEKALQEVKTHPDDPGANGKLGMLLHAYQKFGAAAACYRRARAFDPRSGRWAYYLAVVQAELGEQDNALRSFEESLRLEPDNLAARLRRADLLFQAGRLAESGEIYQAVLEERSSAAAHFGLGRILSSEGDIRAAAGHLQQACKLFPRFREAHYALSRAYRSLGKTAEAEKHLALYQASEEGLPSFPDPLLDRVDALRADSPQQHLRDGLDHERAGELQQALAEYIEAVELNPDYAQAHINLISVYGKLRQFNNAAAHYRRAQAINPNLAEGHYNYGVALLAQDRHTEALEAFQQAIELNPLSADTHHNLGYTLDELGRGDEAVHHYQEAIRHRPNFRLPRYHLARHYYAKGNPGEAIRYLEKTLVPEDEETPGYAYFLALAHARAGNREQAGRYAKMARDKAATFGQQDLVALIEQKFPSVR